MVSIKFGNTPDWIESTIKDRIQPIFKGIMRIVNYNTHQQQKKRIISLWDVKRGDNMDTSRPSQEWTVNFKFIQKKSKGNTHILNVVTAVPKYDNVYPLSDSEEELKESLAVNKDQQKLPECVQKDTTWKIMIK